MDPAKEDVPVDVYYYTNSFTNIILYPTVYNLTNNYIVTNIYDTTIVTYVTNIAAVSTNYSVTNILPVTTTPFTIINLPALTETTGFDITNETDITNFFFITFGRVGTNSVITSVLDPSSTPAFTNSPVAYTNYLTYQAITNSVYFSYIFTTNVMRTSTAGFTPTTNTLAFDDFQMSQDFYITVSESSLGGSGGIGGGGGFGGGGEWSRIGWSSQPGHRHPFEPAAGSAGITGFGPARPGSAEQHGAGEHLEHHLCRGGHRPAGQLSILNFERSTFRVWEN